MSPRFYPLVAAVLSLTSACTKHADRKDDAVAPSAPKRNAAESLGFAAESSEGYFQNNPPPPAATPSSPSTAKKSPPSSAADKTIRRTLTAKDGRKVEAELLARSDSEVKFRRSADAVEFTFPLEKLSEPDQRFIRESALPPLAAR